MNDSDKVMLVILARSIQSEQEGNQFYDRMAEKTQDPTGKELFSRLSAEEKNHEKEMRAKYDEIAQRCGWEPYDGSGTLKFLDHLKEDLPFLGEKQPAFEANLKGRDALEMAIRVEKASANYFLHAAISADQTDAKAFFVELAQSEIKHARILEREFARLSPRS